MILFRAGGNQITRFYVPHADVFADADQPIPVWSERNGENGFLGVLGERCQQVSVVCVEDPNRLSLRKRGDSTSVRTNRRSSNITDAVDIRVGLIE